MTQDGIYHIYPDEPVFTKKAGEPIKEIIAHMGAITYISFGKNEIELWDECRCLTLIKKNPRDDDDIFTLRISTEEKE